MGYCISICRQPYGVIATARISYLRTSERILNTLLVCFVCVDFVPVDNLFHAVSRQPFGGFHVY